MRPEGEVRLLVERNHELKEKVERLEARLARSREAYEALLADLKPLIDRGVLTVRNDDGRVVIGMSADVLFPSGSATLSDGGKANVGELARLLKRFGTDHDFQVEGHTDNQPIATPQFPDNWHLGAARAITVVDFMGAQGFPRGHLSAASFADTRPVTANGTDAGRAANRRIEIVLLPELMPPPRANSGSPPQKSPRPPRKR